MSQMSTKKKTEEAPEPKVKAEKETRWHRVPGRIDRKIVRSYYDPKQDVVKDVLEVPKVVQNRRGHDVDVTLYVHVRSRDEALQAKYRRGDAPVNIDIEEVE